MNIIINIITVSGSLPDCVSASEIEISFGFSSVSVIGWSMELDAQAVFPHSTSEG